MSPTTRAKAHSAGDAANVAAGSKHQLADKDESKSRAKSTKKQKTLEETVKNGKDHKPKSGHEAKQQQDEEVKSQPKKQDHKPKTAPGRRKSRSEPKAKEQDDEPDKTTPDTKPRSTAPNTKPSSSILEKGIIYFFLRGRVNTEDPSSVTDIARTYILLRPMSSSADNNTTKPANQSRLLAVPKKTFPKTGRERCISLVEKTGVSLDDLREQFLSGAEYETKTRGTRHTPPAKPEAEGVYAVVATAAAAATGRRESSHLCYILTRPRELGEVQAKLGLRERGSFVITTRNPQFPPPGGQRLPEAPEFPEEIKKDFHSAKGKGPLRWAPTKPEHLDIEGAQILLVGESSGIEKATEAPGDQEQGGENPCEELEELAEEDEERMEALGEDDSEAIFADLHASAMDHPDMQNVF